MCHWEKMAFRKFSMAANRYIGTVDQLESAEVDAKMTEVSKDGRTMLSKGTKTF